MIAVVAALVAAASYYSGREQGKKQNRAYVYAVPSGRWALSAGNKAHVKVTLKAEGISPAYKVSIGDSLEVHEYPLPEEDAHLEGKTTPHQNAFLFKEVTADDLLETVDPLTLEQVERVTDGSRFRLYAAGEVTYRDTFGDSHSTTFCWMYSGVDLANVEPCPHEGMNYGN